MSSHRGKKFYYILMLGFMYFSSFLLLTVGYFTPAWVNIDLRSGAYDGYGYWSYLFHNPTYNMYIQPSNPYSIWNCYSIGLVKPTQLCDEPIYDWLKDENVNSFGRTAYILDNVFILMTTAIVAVYINAILLLAGFAFRQLDNIFYMSCLSLSFGVFYPAAAILVLVATIQLEAFVTDKSGYSVILCTVAGCLMFLFYVGLIWYDQNYKRFQQKTRESSTKPTALQGKRSLMVRSSSNVDHTADVRDGDYISREKLVRRRKMLMTKQGLNNTRMA